jgi:hypothetical protein
VLRAGHGVLIAVRMAAGAASEVVPRPALVSLDRLGAAIRVAKG